MRLALVIFKYFPYGGLQRDFFEIARLLQARGCQCRVYCLDWQGERLAGIDLRCLPARALSNHARYRRFLEHVQKDLAADPVDGVVGFNKMPGLDVYFAADPCFLEKLSRRGWWYRQSARARHFAAWEQAVFAPGSATRILLLADTQRKHFSRHYQTPAERMITLPAGVLPDRSYPEDAVDRRRAAREALGVEPAEMVLLALGSGFATKGLDRTIDVLADIRREQPAQAVRLLVVGQDRYRRFQRRAKKLGLADSVFFLGGRVDVVDLMLASDLLVHPARNEAAGVVLLEALVMGLPVVATDVCGHAHHVTAARAGQVLPSPFSHHDLKRAVMRYFDGVFRADCRESALLYTRLTDLRSTHAFGADMIRQIIAGRMAGRRD
jgi:UDP-glucose:(heptosyl)LPS alpha-1,3-glucosyltransferase